MEFFSSVQVFDCYSYARLSKEDGDKLESDSIKNQREMIRDFIARNSDLRLAMEGFDDGFTGTNFQRPSFQEMLAAIKARKINCVVVKDLSRFGREYIESGRYIERIFPALGVRFIAINDNYDNAKLDASASLMLPFKNLINDSYCRDTSIKIRSHFDVKRRNGEFIGSFAAYGYVKAPEDKNKLVIDDEAAAVVQDIFAWKLGGLSNQAISDKLNALGILSPMEYKKASGLHYESGYKAHSKAIWSSVTVGRILKNAVYLGIMEQGKRTTPNYKVKTVVERPPSEWSRVADTHEAIISQEDFDLAARLSLFDTRSAPGEEAVYPLAGLLSCGDCGGGMVRKTASDHGKKYFYYICGGHKTDKTRCTTHNISAVRLETAVLAGVNFHIQSVADLQNALEAVSRRPGQKIELKKLNHRLVSLERELEKTQALKDALYRRFALGEIALEDFTEIKRIFNQDCGQVEHSILEQKKLLDGIQNSGCPDSPWIAYFQQFGQVEALTRAVTVKLIERVQVFEGGRVEITFRYQSEYEMSLQFLAIQAGNCAKEAV